ncbi:hypothetical protein FOBRF1_013267 [Fusarium oxysporum]
MDNLNADIPVGQDTTNTRGFFNLHNESLIPSIPRLGESRLQPHPPHKKLRAGCYNATEVKSKLGGNPSGSSECVAGVEAQADIDQREIAGREREALRVHERTSASA